MHFEIYTDHYSLQRLRMTKAVDCVLLHRWRSELEKFNFVVKHQPGKSQNHVDALSRLPVGPKDDSCTLLELPDEVQQELGIALTNKAGSPWGLWQGGI